MEGGSRVEPGKGMVKEHISIGHYHHFTPQLIIRIGDGIRKADPLLTPLPHYHHFELGSIAQGGGGSCSGGEEMDGGNIRID